MPGGKIVGDSPSLSYASVGLAPESECLFKFSAFGVSLTSS